MLKTVQCTAVQRQWLVAGWLGPSVTVRVKVRARAREWCFFFIFKVRHLGVYVRRKHRVSQTSWVILWDLKATLDTWFSAVILYFSCHVT